MMVSGLFDGDSAGLPTSSSSSSPSTRNVEVGGEGAHDG